MAYSAPSSRSTSDLITAAIWNADVVANPIAIYAGAMSVSSQAVGDILYASSTTQLGRIAAVATGQVLTSAGTGTVPAWSSNLSLGGTLGVAGAVTFNDAGADVDFRVESDDDANCLFVDGSTDRVGIGTNAPTNALTIVGAGALSTGTEVMIDRSLGGGAYGSTGANAIVFINSHTGSTNNNHTEASIRFSNDNTLKWQIGMLGQAGSALTDFEIRNPVLDKTSCVIYGANGNVVFNEEGIDADFRVEGDGNEHALFVDGQTDRVGIGTTSGPETTLHLRASDFPSFTMQRTTGTAGHGNGITFKMGNSASATTATSYATMYPYIADNTDGSEDASFVLNLKKNGSLDEVFRIFGASGGMGLGSTDDPGTDALHVAGALSKGSGSFKIDHPLPALADSKFLIHSFVEGPRADLIYRGTATLDAGIATIDLDEASGMTSGTWVLLCRDEQCYTTNETGWHHVRGSVSGSTLTIDCEEECDDVVSWMVVACRKDPHMMSSDTKWTDDQGYPIVEPDKPEPGVEPEAIE